jgi:uncharacterized membrane protein
MRSYLLAAISCALCVSSTVHADSAAPDQTKPSARLYKLTPLTNPDTQRNFFPSDLNNRGELVGQTARLDEFESQHGASWKRGTVHFLPELPNSTRSEAAAVNDRGDFVGRDFVNGLASVNAVLGQNGRLIELGTPPGTTSFTPMGLNNGRQVIGNASDSNGYVWSHGTFTQLALAVDSRSPQPRDINNVGTVAGTEKTPFFAGSSAAIWRDGGIELLGVLPGKTSSEANALNDLDHVVGVSSGTGEQAFFWKDGTMTALPPLVAGDSTIALSINDRDQVVGYEISGAGYQMSPVIWEHGQPTLLTDLIRPEDLAQIDPTLALRSATRINGLGQIIAWASPIDPNGMGDVAYLLTPVYERR